MTDATAVEKTVAEVAKDFGRMDVMIANAGESCSYVFNLSTRLTPFRHGQLQGPA